jgi:hypothetical protein
MRSQLVLDFGESTGARDLQQEVSISHDYSVGAILCLIVDTVHFPYSRMQRACLLLKPGLCNVMHHVIQVARW